MKENQKINIFYVKKESLQYASKPSTASSGNEHMKARV